MKLFQASLLLVGCCFLTATGLVAADKRTLIADEKISLIVPEGWKESKLNPTTTIAGWESPDQKASFFFQPVSADVDVSMSELMDQTVAKFETSESFIFEKIGKYTTGQVKGSKKPFPAIYTTMEVVFKTEPENVQLKYYLLIFDTGVDQYFLQASVVKPVWEARENQILTMIQSLVARK